MYKKIFDKYEKLTYTKLDEICSRVNASVYPKVRIADIFSIAGSGLTDEEYGLALKGHFDFTVYDNANDEPLFSVEFDGNSHRREEQKRRDFLKNSIIEKFNFPLLRINSKYLEKKYRELDLLTWCIEVWFSAEAFFKAQEEGLIPLDEPFSADAIYYSPGYDNKFPFNLSYDINKSIRVMHEQRKIKSFCPNIWIGTDINLNYFGISWLVIDDDIGIISFSGMKAQRFPVMESDLLGEIMIFELFEQMNRFYNGEPVAVKNNHIFEKIEAYQQRYKMAINSGGSS